MTKEGNLSQLEAGFRLIATVPRRMCLILFQEQEFGEIGRRSFEMGYAK
jgi:hypothetical protein